MMDHHMQFPYVIGVSAGIDGEKCAEAAATYLGVMTD
jgi:hypothetical protein